MHQLSTLMAVFVITAVYAVPLNINLGAYSPAMVVGDGEILFGTPTDASTLMNTLQGQAVSQGAAAAAGAGGATAGGTAAGGAGAGTAGAGAGAGKTNNNQFASPLATVPAPAAPIPASVAAPETAPATPDQQAPVTPVVPAVVQEPPTAPSEPSPSPTLQSGLGMGPDKKFILPREPVVEPEAELDLAEAIRSLQRDVASLKEGKLLQRDAASLKEGKPIESVLTPRDLAGFQAALNYAAGALKTSPTIELGTGAEGSGVGIKVGAAGAAGATKVGKRGITAIKVISKRDTPESENHDATTPTSPEGVDAVNLNLGSGDVSLTITEI